MGLLPQFHINGRNAGSKVTGKRLSKGKEEERFTTRRKFLVNFFPNLSKTAEAIEGTTTEQQQK